MVKAPETGAGISGGPPRPSAGSSPASPTTFRVRLWCRDCTGEDPQGCFDGGTQLLETSAPPFDPATFPTLSAAVDAGHAETKDCGPWEFDVIDADDNEVDYGNMTQEQIDHYTVAEMEGK